MNTVYIHGVGVTALGLRVPATDFSDLEYACQTLGGQYFWPLDPKHPSNRLSIEQIAHSLANQSRWGGFCTDLETGEPVHYSVAQHSVHVADIANIARVQIAALLGLTIDWERQKAPTARGHIHDGTEAYLVDIPRPIKGSLGDYYGIEAALNERIMAEFDIPFDPVIDKIVKWVDNAMIFWERDELIGKPEVPYTNENMHPGTSIHDVIPNFRPWSAKEAKQRFIEKFYEIKRYDGNMIPANYDGFEMTIAA